MPKLDNGGFGSKFGFQIDKQNENVGFEDSSHTYFDLKTGQKYISCTQLIHEFVPPFNSEFWSSYKALEKIMDPDSWRILRSELLKTKVFKEKFLNEFNIDADLFLQKKQEILDSYKKAGEDACIRGTAIHLERELAFYEDANANIKKYGLTGTFSCNKNKYILDDERGIYPELLLSYNDDELRIGAQADLVCKDGNDIYILDYKTSNKIVKKGYYDKVTGKTESLLFPLNNLPNVNFYIYSLQLSTYMWIIQQQHPEFKCKKLVIVHILPDGSEVNYECEYLKKDVENMIKHYKYKQRLKTELDKDKPIIF